MSHMVIYRGSDGKPGYHQTDDIHDAVGFVEQMRNDQGVEHARIFRLEEVVFQYRPYFRVELAESGFRELGSTTDAAGDRASGHGSGSGSGNGSLHGSGNGSANRELGIGANGGGINPGGSDTANGGSGNGSSESPSPVATGSTPTAPPPSPSTATPSDDVGGSKRGLFGR